MGSSLKSFIRAVRATKTIAEERAVIRKESAKIRTAFRDPRQDEIHRRKNIEKLLYLYILGEPTYFGQVECLKLLVSPSLPSKRLGYLAAMLILDENQEILTLLTNSLDNDLKSDNQYIAGMALATLGNVASPELAKDLYANVDSLLSSSTPYLKKKAAIVAAKLVKKEPDLAEVFAEKLPNLLNDKNHGVSLGTLQLIKVVYASDDSVKAPLLALVPKILAHLKFLATTGYSPEYDVKSVPDPFLYVSLLQTLRELLQDDPENPNMEQLNDLLTQICVRLEKGKGPAHAVLYEAVQAIFALNTDSSLRVMGVNILSKFLALKDNNTRYVALNTLLSVVQSDPLAVQRHRNTIVGCLQDGDISIRRRALEVTFATINRQNLRLLTKELLKFLANADDELKPYITTQLSLAIYADSPSMEWTFDTFVQMLQIAGNYFSDEILSSILATVMQNDDDSLTKKFVEQLVQAAQALPDQFGLALVTLWCVGEYGSLIEGDIPNSQIVDLLDTLMAVSTLDEPARRNQLQLYGLTSALKLSSRIKEARQIERLRKIIDSATGDTSLEIQVRAIEYQEIFGEPPAVKKGLLERMPAPPKKVHQGTALLERKPRKETKGDSLLKLLDDEPEVEAKVEAKADTLDLLSDIFGATSVSTTPAKPTKTSSDAILDILGQPAKPKVAPVAPAAAPAATTAAPAAPSIEAFSDSTLSVGFTTQKSGEGIAQIESHVTNNSSSPVSGITVLCAVTKQQRLQLSAISRTSLSPGDTATSHIKITGRPGSKIKMRYKLGYSVGGQAVQQQFDVTMPEKL